MKDRLADLHKASRGKQKENRNVDIEQGQETSTSNQEGGSTLRQAFDRADVLGQWIQSIEQNVEALRQYIGKVDDLKINQKDLADKIDNLCQNNTSISHKITAKLKECEEELKNSDGTSAESRIKTIQYNTLKTRYQKAFKSYNAVIENYRDIKKDQLEAQLRAKGVKATEEELTSLLEGNTNIEIFTENILAETREAKQMLRDIEERHQQLKKIEQTLVEVRDLFLQMGILIETQQELVDRVEYQAAAAAEFVDSGREKLIIGNKQRRKNLKCKIYFGIAVVIVLVIVLLMIFIR